MEVKCINENSGLVIDEIYQVVIIHSEGYELKNDPNRYDPDHFEIIECPEPSDDDLFYQMWGMTKEEYIDIYGELP
jgi:hypothetical protein